jgi:hypothetical protein
MTGKVKNVFFVLNLVQDVNIVRELVYLTARETEAQIGFLVSEAFRKRDRQKIWQREVAIMAAATGATMHLYGSAGDALAILADGAGIIFCASESNLAAHRETAEVFQVAPPTYLRVTLQHGFECIGFLQSREHVMSHGRNISFSADVVCSWFAIDALTSLNASERSKLYVAGPPTLLRRTVAADHEPVQSGGLVCENLHSVRLRASGDHKSSFMEIFFAYCAEMARRGERITLRPHPGGQYVLKNQVSLPDNVVLESRPLYEVGLDTFRYGISAPSTIVFDMILAGIPVGLWRDPGGVMDASNYDGLTEISALEDWLAFERDVELRPEMLLDRQQAFLRRLAMPLDPDDVYRRYARLIVQGLAGMRSPGEGLTTELRTSSAVRARKRPVVLCEGVLTEESA